MKNIMFKNILICSVLFNEVFSVDLFRSAILLKAPAIEIKQDLKSVSKDSVHEVSQVVPAGLHSDILIGNDKQKTKKCACVPEGEPTTDASAYDDCPDIIEEGSYMTHPDQFKSTPELLETYGYPHMEYKVKTDDDYILTVFRITGSPKRNASKAHGTPVYVNHGLIGSSDWWFFLPPEKTLGELQSFEKFVFLMADRGYDVWISNARGTTYSLEHETLYHGNLEYWDFSFHEMGIYDIPAVTDMILEETGRSSILYLGWSMGCTALLVCLSELPVMNSKIRVAFFLAPAAFLGHSNTPMRGMAEACATEEALRVFNSAFKGKIQSEQDVRRMMKMTGSNICSVSAAKCGLCDSYLFAWMGMNAPQLNRSVLPLYYEKMPNSASIKSFVHYAQLVVACRFQRFDYTPTKNLELYGSPRPPAYDLSKFRSPLYVYHGDQDSFLAPTDLREMLSQFRKGVVQKSVRIEDKLFTHVDFGLAKDADKLVYKGLLKDMHKYIDAN